MTRRIVAITVAIALAALGTIGGVYLVLSADSRARDALTDAVSVAVATKAISRGTLGSEIRLKNLVRFEKMPRSSVPSDALSAIGTDLDQQVLLSTVAKGQILLRANFGERSQGTGGLPVPEGKMAVTVQTGAPEQVAGYVGSGSQIAIFLTYRVVSESGANTNRQRTRVLLPRVEVLAVGPAGSRGDTASSGSRGGSLLVTVAVTQQEAERLIEGLNHGTLYLGLLTDSTDVKAGPGVDNTDSDNESIPLFK